MHKRLLIILTTITLSTALFIGCGNKQEEIPQATIEESAPEQTEEETTPQTEIAETTPEVTDEPVEEATTEPDTTEPMETAEPEPTEEPTPEPEPQTTYTYTDMSATMYAQQTVNVRDLPDTSGNKLGSLSTNDEIAITGKCNETGWYRFNYNGNVAYVSDKYLSDKKVEKPAASESAASNTGSTASNTCPYTLWQPVDNWDTISWYVTQPDPNWESEHRATQKWMIDTLRERFSGNIPAGGTGYADQMTWQYIGTYAEGNVYLQVWNYVIE